MTDRQKEYEALLASRGLIIVRFDGETLFLKYHFEADPELKKRMVEGAELSLHAINAMNEQLPGPELFPGIRKVTVDLS